MTGVQTCALPISADDAFSALQQIVKDHKTVTLVYGAKDETHNQAVVLAEELKKLPLK